VIAGLIGGVLERFTISWNPYARVHVSRTIASYALQLTASEKGDEDRRLLAARPVI
jgi:hypothetical protein